MAWGYRNSGLVGLAVPGILARGRGGQTAVDVPVVIGDLNVEPSCGSGSYVTREGDRRQEQTGRRNRDRKNSDSLEQTVYHVHAPPAAHMRGVGGALFHRTRRELSSTRGQSN